MKKDMIFPAFPILLLAVLAAMLTFSQATLCTQICNGSCDGTEFFISKMTEMTQVEIAQNANKCNTVCVPVCNCIDNCFGPCFKQLGICRLKAGDNPAAFFSCQVQFSSCGTPCDNQCAAAVNMAAAQLEDMLDSLTVSIRLSISQVIETFSKPIEIAASSVSGTSGTEQTEAQPPAPATK